MKAKRHAIRLDVTETEGAALVVLLRELRRAAKLKRQLEIMIDPWTAPGCDGYTIFAAPHAEGNHYEVGTQPGKAKGRGR